MSDQASGHYHTCCTWHHLLVKGNNCSFQSNKEQSQTQAPPASKLSVRGNMLRRNCAAYTYGFTGKIRTWLLNVKLMSLPKLTSVHSALKCTHAKVWTTTEACPDRNISPGLAGWKDVHTKQEIPFQMHMMSSYTCPQRVHIGRHTEVDVHICVYLDIAHE